MSRRFEGTTYAEVRGTSEPYLLLTLSGRLPGVGRGGRHSGPRRGRTGTLQTLRLNRIGDQCVIPNVPQTTGAVVRLEHWLHVRPLSSLEHAPVGVPRIGCGDAPRNPRRRSNFGRDSVEELGSSGIAFQAAADERRPSPDHDEAMTATSPLPAALPSELVLMLVEDVFPQLGARDRKRLAEIASEDLEVFVSQLVTDRDAAAPAADRALSRTLAYLEKIGK